MRGMLLISIVLLAGCVSEKKIHKYIDKHPEVLSDYFDTVPQIIHDTLKVEVIVPHVIKADTVRVSTPVKQPNKPHTSVVMADLPSAHARAYFDGDSLYIELFQKEKILSIPGKVDVPIVHTDRTIVYTPPPEKIVPRFHHFFKNGFFVVTALLILTIVLLIRAIKK